MILLSNIRVHSRSFAVKQFITILSFLSSLLPVHTTAEPVFIGTGADGIYLADFNPETGTLSEPKLAAEYETPSFLVAHPKLPVLLCVGLPKTPIFLGGGSVAAFTINKDHSLTFLGERSSAGRGACHIAVDATGQIAAIANYSGGGSVATIRLDENGIPTEVADVIVTGHGSGPNKERQDGPHPHGVYFDKANRFLFVPDLGLDKTFVYTFSPTKWRLGAHEPPALTAPPGSGPRHMTFSADEKHAYVINELLSTITVAEYNSSNATFKDIQTINTLPEDFKEQNTTAEIEVHPNGNFVYASNRGHDSIAVFKRDTSTGTLTFLQHAPCGGKHPRHFILHPSGKWLLCGHMNSDTISILPLNPETGLLSKPSQTIPCPKPTCILFR